MRTILLCITFLLSGIINAQTIENPSFKARTGSIRNITRIERTPEATKLYIHAIFRPHWWIKEEGDSYLVDVATQAKYKFLKAEGIEVNKEVYMPASGEKDYILYFEPLPKETQRIHLLNTSPNSETNTYDISLVKAKKKKATPLETIKGNWYKADVTNQWEYGIYDSISIIQNRIFTNKSIRKKGKSIEICVKDKQQGFESTLLLTPQKDGNCLIKTNGVNEYLYTKQKSKHKAIAADPDFKDFFRQDTAFFQGYIEGYDPRLGFETGLVYLDNILTREDFPTVVTIHPDGTFEAKLPLNYPIQKALSINNLHIPFYIEPGETLTMYLNWEAMLAFNRARNYNLPIENIEYMGPSAYLSYLYKDLRSLISYPYNKLSKAQKQLTPNEFKEMVKPDFSKWDQIGDSLTQIYGVSDKAVHLLKNKINIKKGYTLFVYLMSRDYYARQDTANQALKVKEDKSYYEFLKYMPLNDEVVIANEDASSFINRFEYMNPFFNGNNSNLQADSITVKYPTKILLTFLKEKGIKLNSDQEKLRIRQEKFAGKTFKQATKDTQNDLQIILNLYQTEKELIKEHEKLYIRMGEKDTSELSKEELDKRNWSFKKRFITFGDSILNLLSGQSNPFLYQAALVRRLNDDLKNYKTREWAERHTDTLAQRLTYPFLVVEAQRMLNKTHPYNTATSYKLPEGKATDIFRNIIKAHSGKVLFVDFWSTGCGPCRAGIEATAKLREKYKNHPEFQFIYITSQKESPKESYDEYVGKHLKGEASYWINETEFHYLRELFKFNGIPHYELVEKDGNIANKCPRSWDLQEYLKKRFENNGSAK